ncbi:acid-sensing ion channel 2-like [Lingula anatina]|uniref:Acid-sensing ion channel 2-like n=1 Tax=Lingula anatina TaxID=7574 RepID=A0A1S3JGF0_LINAN|nr:acid-sensing ion channel 2-like [Lingula anatina]|eukprot:XP_013409485.1 acid-sensing ion channel 2-like [Lingula anatina]
MNSVGVHPSEKAFNRADELNCKSYRSGYDETLQETTVQIEMTTFANEVSILGLKQSVNPKYSHFRRTLWLCFVLAGFGFLLYHLWHRIAYFLSNPVTVKIDVVANDTLVFPAITICINSPLKMSSLVANNESYIGKYFGTFEDPQDLSSYNLGRINWTEFMIRNGYDKRDIFLDVKWKLKDVRLADIRPVFTSLGLCYQINSDDSMFNKKKAVAIEPRYTIMSHNLTMRRCGCRLVYYPHVPGYRECSPQDVFQCVFNLTRQKTRFIRQCDCSVECESYRFEYTLSSSFIANSSMQLLQHLLNITKEEVEKDIVATKIFYADMTYEELEQQEAYSDSHLHVDAEGMYGGLRLSILVSRKEYVKHSYLAGLSLNLHNPEDRPDGNTGILIPPGGFTNIALKLKHLVNLPPPHGKCGERPLAYYKKYSKTNCQTECLHNLTLTRCNCRLTFYPYVPGFRDCSPKDRKLCVDPLTFLNRSQLHRQCGCKVACETFKYETSSTYTKLSESTFENVQEWNMLQERLEDFIGVLIFYPDMSYEEVVQQEAYSTLALLADIGGALGLVLGSTLMTLAEILDFFFGLCVWKALGVRI